MNELLRLLQKSLRPFGYDIKKHSKYNLLPIKNIKALPNAHELKQVKFCFDAPSPKTSQPDLSKLVVFIRTCLRTNRNVDKTPRFTQASIAETVYRCISSTINSVNFAHLSSTERTIKVILLDDHSDDDYATNLKALCANLKCSWEFKTTKDIGQGQSLHEQFSLAREENALCYFCEDDYLHTPSAIQEMWDFYRQVYEQTHQHLVVHPQEHENLYASDYYPSYLVLSHHRHWRTMSHATHVFLTHGHVVDQYWQYFENTKFVGDKKNRRKGSEAKTTNNLFKHIPGFSPIPSLAGHTQFEFTLPPFFDWKAIWKENAVNFKKSS